MQWNSNLPDVPVATPTTPLREMTDTSAEHADKHRVHSKISKVGRLRVSAIRLFREWENDFYRKGRSLPEPFRRANHVDVKLSFVRPTSMVSQYSKFRSGPNSSSSLWHNPLQHCFQDFQLHGSGPFCCYFQPFLSYHGLEPLVVISNNSARVSFNLASQLTYIGISKERFNVAVST